MSILEIEKYPSHILTKACLRVNKIGPEEEKTLKDMASTMYENQGIGLAASQVGISKRLIVIDVGSGLIELANPRILRKSGSMVMEEGCLSLPGVCIKIKRAEQVLVEFLDRSGNKTTLEAQGLLARAIQHEIDHLNGRIIIDYLGPIKKLFLKRKLSKVMTCKNTCKRL